MNEGFKALPEYVQRKIDPEAAEKYQEGGSVSLGPISIILDLYADLADNKGYI